MDPVYCTKNRNKDIAVIEHEKQRHHWCFPKENNEDGFPGITKPKSAGLNVFYSALPLESDFPPGEL